MPLLTSQTALRVKLERVVLCHYAEARAEWRKYLFMDMHDDREVMEKVRREKSRARKNSHRWTRIYTDKNSIFYLSDLCSSVANDLRSDS